MFRIRLHGRGGQGMKTASMILGSAFFAEGYEVQDAPRYGAERRGAPIFAYVRADRAAIQERGVISRPDLVIVGDESLVTVPAAGVMQGVNDRTVLLIHSEESKAVWKDRLKFPGTVLRLPLDARAPDSAGFVGAACAGAAARLAGVVSRESVAHAVNHELRMHPVAVRERNLAQALAAFDALAGHAGCVAEGGNLGAQAYAAPDWIEMPLEGASQSAPDIRSPANSELANTGLWRVMRPVIDYEHCKRCSWVCSSLCPDSAIRVERDHTPRIDYDHCKGCMVCVAVCPSHAIRGIPERDSKAGPKERAA